MRHNFFRAVITHRDDAAAVGHQWRRPARVCHACAMAQAIERLFATPKTIPSFPASDDINFALAERIFEFVARKSFATNRQKWTRFLEPLIWRQSNSNLLKPEFYSRYSPTL